MKETAEVSSLHDAISLADDQRVRCLSDQNMHIDFMLNPHILLNLCLVFRNIRHSGHGGDLHRTSFASYWLVLCYH